LIALVQKPKQLLKNCIGEVLLLENLRFHSEESGDVVAKN
jgi:3-phosphoglycerate kinase